jgi:catechol 2,3-dioxygenase-like lactoylglutathione lyase family enzyme
MTIQNVNVVSVPVSDQDRAKAFYVDTLGLTLVRDDDSVPGLRWIQVAPAGGGTTLTLVNWFDEMPPGSLHGLVLSSTDLDADCDAISSRGGRFDSPPRRQPWAVEAVLRDPDGNMIVLQQG